MEDRDEVLKQIIKFAEENDNIRAFVLQGSLVNPNAEIDYYSDIDPLFYVVNSKELASNTKWIYQFGNTISQLFDESTSKDGTIHYMRMVIYESGLKVDFGITSIDSAKSANEMPLYKVVLDKDGILPFPDTTNDSKFHVKKPTQKEYLSKINDFFWDSTYIAKSLYREEIYFAKFMESNIHLIIRPIIEWYIGINYDFQVNTGLEGRYFKKYLSESDWQLVLNSYSDSDTSNIFESIYFTYDLVRHMGKRIAEALNYSYPIENEQKVLEYIMKIERQTRGK